jgi:hypothetical protein
MLRRRALSTQGSGDALQGELGTHNDSAMSSDSHHFGVIGGLLHGMAAVPRRGFVFLRSKGLGPHSDPNEIPDLQVAVQASG